MSEFSAILFEINEVDGLVNLKSIHTIINPIKISIIPKYLMVPLKFITFIPHPIINIHFPSIISQHPTNCAACQVLNALEKPPEV